MKLQTLAVIFVLIILPISIVLSEYVQIQIDTLKNQTAYDSQLLSATYDAVVAFQKNTVNSWSSSITSSKIRDIEASSDVFFNSVANNFKLSGNTKDAIKEYVPALVYTLYDGYYIYTPFTNTLGDDLNVSENSTYQDGDRVFGLKPYIYYSREYKINDDNDFVITYSLDNYINIQGKVKGNIVNEGGYLIDINNSGTTSDGTKYKGATIQNEVYEEYVDKDNKYRCVKINGTKYYLENDRVFYYVQSGRNYLTGDYAKNFRNKFFNNDYNSAKEYYENAYKFTQKVIGTGSEDFNLSGLTSSEAKDYDASKQSNYNIFDVNNIEYYNSHFNQERREVIKNSIEKNLPTAIANFSNISKTDKVNFQMPKLSEDEWDKIINSFSLITFLQGINMGNRPYNGYAIVPNNKNMESVGEESIYIVTGDGKYHRVNDADLIKDGTQLVQGVFNMNFERKTIDEIADDGSTVDKNSFYPKKESACYDCIVNQTNIIPLQKELANGDKIPKTIYEYLDEHNTPKGAELANIYYTALGRERNGLVKFGLKEKIDEIHGEISDNATLTVGEIPLTQSNIIGNEALKLMYGQDTDYTSEQGVTWQLFYDDTDNIYLIASDYVPNTSLPSELIKSTITADNIKDYCACFATYENSTYSGTIMENAPWSNGTNSRTITENAQTSAYLKWVNSSVVTKRNNPNMKAVAYMMDISKWSNFAGNANGAYAIGGPTLEMFALSYNAKHDTKLGTYESINETNADLNGYKVKIGTNSWSVAAYELDKSNAEGSTGGNMWIKTSTDKAHAYWLSSPMSDNSKFVRIVSWSGSLDHNYVSVNGKHTGFRPVVSIPKSSI